MIFFMPFRNETNLLFFSFFSFTRMFNQHHKLQLWESWKFNLAYIERFEGQFYWKYEVQIFKYILQQCII
jgi:hypothetical protein